MAEHRETNGAQPTGQELKKVEFHYIKSSDYRTVPVNGVIGALTPTGSLSMTIYSEHASIPQKTVSVLNADGKLGAEISEERIGRGGIVRDLAATLILDRATAVAIRDWLVKRITEMDKKASASSSGGSKK